jgi:hypothetical protein
MNIFDEYEAEMLAASNTPEALAQDAADTAKRAARAAAYIEPVAAPEPTTCDMCGDDLDDGECQFCDA